MIKIIACAPKKSFLSQHLFYFFLFALLDFVYSQINYGKKLFNGRRGGGKKQTFLSNTDTQIVRTKQEHIEKKNTAIWQIQLKSKQGRQHDSITFNLFFYCSSSCIWVGSIKLYVYQTFLITVDKISLSLLYFKIYIISDRKI